MKDMFGLSPQQRRLWQLQQDGSRYWARGAAVLEGPLDQSLLQDALAHVVARHEILRTRIGLDPCTDLPKQVIGTASPPLLVWLDPGRPVSTHAVVDSLLDTPRRSEYVDDGPVLEVAVAPCGAERHVLSVSLPSSCADASSIGQLLSEVVRSYGAKPTDRADALQYAEVAAWLNDLPGSEESAAGVSYWRTRFADPSGFHLPFEQGAAEGAFDPCSVRMPDDPLLYDRILTRAGNDDTKAAVFLLTCWQILLWRLTGRSPVVTGVLHDGRLYEDLVSVLGPLARYVPARLDLDSSVSLLAAVEATARGWDDDRAWQECFLWEEAWSGRDEQKTPFFPYCFEYHEPRIETAGPLRFSVERRDVTSDRFRMRMSWEGLARGSCGSLSYDPAVFSGAAVAVVADQYRSLLLDALARPSAAVGDLNCLGEGERRRLVVDLNQTSRPDAPRCAHELVEEQVRRTPDNIAVRWSGGDMRYRELDRRADELARRLRGCGVAPDSPVGLLVDRSPEALVGILGILKAGAAYLPLEAGLPPERLRFMLEDTGTSFVVSVPRLEQEFEDCRAGRFSHVAWIGIDDEGAAPTGAPGSFTGVTPDHLAYVMYTSGSTGRPKGVMVTHRGLANYLEWSARAYSLAQGVGVPVHSAIGFDLTVTALLAPLAVGQTVLLLPEERGLEGLRDVLSTCPDTTLVKITPSQLDALRHIIEPTDAWKAPRAFVIGGEGLFAETLAVWRERAPQTRLINEYGPTEAVVGCVVHEVRPTDPASGRVPIGRPIDNMQVYVLDAELDPVARGMVGEVFLGGVGLARGYWNRPDLTAERFVPDPFSVQPGSRLYRTGDLARFRLDDTLEFLGRADHQVKVRGVRVELEEVEGVIAEHPAVEDAVVVTMMEEQEVRLAAYVVFRAGEALVPGDLERFVRARLPSYMVPSFLVPIAALPLTENGKVDRGALSRREAVRAPSAPHMAPRSALEKVVAGIWSEVLGRVETGIHDNFFELGGHSLSAARVVARIRSLVEVDVPLRRLFEAPTVAELTDVILASADGSNAERIARFLLEVVDASDAELEALSTVSGDER